MPPGRSAKVQPSPRNPRQVSIGLSATPDREDLDVKGAPLRYYEQVVGQSLGDVVFRFGTQGGPGGRLVARIHVAPSCDSLLTDERSHYESLSRQVDDSGDEMRALGGEPSRGRQLAAAVDQLGSAAKRWVALTGQRKDMLYRASERHRIAVQLTNSLFAGESDARVILFHERVREAEELHATLAASLPGHRVVLEHSKLSATRFALRHCETLPLALRPCWCR